MVGAARGGEDRDPSAGVIRARCRVPRSNCNLVVILIAGRSVPTVADPFVRRNRRARVAARCRPGILMVGRKNRRHACIHALGRNRVTPGLDTGDAALTRGLIDVKLKLVRRPAADALRCVIRDRGPIGCGVFRGIPREHGNQLRLHRADQLPDLDIRVSPAALESEPAGVRPAWRAPRSDAGFGVRLIELCDRRVTDFLPRVEGQVLRDRKVCGLVHDETLIVNHGDPGERHPLQHARD